MNARLALITAEYPCGASEAFLEAELAELSTQFAVRLYPTRTSGAVRRVPPGVDVCALRLLDPRTVSLALHEATRSPLAVLRVLGRVVGAGGSARARLTDLAVFVKALAIATDCRRNGIRHVHAFWLSTPATIAYIVSEVTSIPYSLSAHRWDIYASLGQRRKTRTARFIRVISERGARDLRAAIGPPAAERVAVVHLGVDVPGRAAPADDYRSLRIVMSASLVEIKDHGTLFTALTMLRERGVAFHCTLAGDGPLRAAYERRVRDLRIAAFVTFAGHLDHAALVAEYAAGTYNAGVLTSRESSGGFMEGVPVSLMEAMAAGIPCIATRTGSIPELIEPACGVLVPQQDPQALADALHGLLADPQRARQLGAAGRARVCERFDTRRNALDVARRIQRELA